MQQNGIAAPPPTSAAVMSRLTARQQEILTCFLAEPNEARIGKRLGLAPQTVRNHIAGILKRLKVSCRAELVKVALLAGFHNNQQDGRAVDGGDAEADVCDASTQTVLDAPTSDIEPTVKRSDTAQSRKGGPVNVGVWGDRGQDGGGRVGGKPGDLYGTAVACFILAIPNRYLPILQEGKIESLRTRPPGAR